MQRVQRFILLCSWAGCALPIVAQEPDMARFRDHRTFNNPYDNVREVPEAAPAPADTSRREPHVSIHLPPSIERGWNYYVNNTDTVVQGFRLQIFMGDPEEASRVKFQFMQRFNDTPVYSLFESPYWKVRIGDFPTRREAERYQKKLRESFPGAFIVPETVILRFE